MREGGPLRDHLQSTEKCVSSLSGKNAGNTIAKAEFENRRKIQRSERDRRK